MPSRPRSPWKIAGFGCAALLVAVAVALVAFLFVGQRMARRVREQTVDPALRSTRVQEVLPAPAWPAGYEPVLGISVPLLGRVAVLERPPATPGPGDEIGSRGRFLYLVRGRSDRVERRGDDLERLLDLRGLEVERGGPVASGELTVGETVLVYRTIRARLTARPRGAWPVLAALVDVRCPDAGKTVRFGAWIEPDPASGRPPEESDLAGTPADPEAIRRFMASFRFCS
jgi:hypothetical protein